MFHMLSCFNLRPGIAIDEFTKSLLAFEDHMQEQNLLVSIGPIGSRAEGRRFAYGVQSPYFRITRSHWWDAHSMRSE